MKRLLLVPVLAAALANVPSPARADYDDHPGLGFIGDFLITTAAAPCGVGTLPRGHFPPEVPAIGAIQTIKLTVRQDANRLCYVFGRIAEAPVIRVRQGGDLIITLRNEITDPGALDAVVAPATLDKPNEPVPAQAAFVPVIPAMHHPATGATNLHLHGFSVSPTVPQDEVLKTCVDPAVGPARCGQRQFTYHFQVPDGMPAGLYWYHPHVHGEVHPQMLLGLSGPIVVEGREDDARRAAGIGDRIFVIRQASDPDSQNASGQSGPVRQNDDRLIRPDTASSVGRPIDTAHEMPCSAKTGTDELTLNGAKVLDGKVQDSDLAAIEMSPGSSQLWRFLNAASDAFLDLALVDEAGRPVPVGLVARDGAPITDDAGRLLPPEATSDPQLVPPAGRIEFLVKAPEPGRKIYLVTHAVDTGCAGDKVPERRLAYVTGRGPSLAAAAALPAPAIEPVPSPYNHLLARRTDRERVLAFAEYPHPGPADLNDFYLAERKPDGVLVPFEMGGPPAITVRSGTTEEWVVENWTNELHAFHIHQLHFRVLEINGRKLPAPPLLDVITVPTAQPAGGPGDVTTASSRIIPGQVRVKLFFPPELAGDIPFHCHLVDHEDAGMMGVLRLLAEGQPDAPADRRADIDRRSDIGRTVDLLHPPVCRQPRQQTPAANQRG